MAKKRRSAKQKANDRRLGAMARARGKKSTPKRRRKTIKQKSSRRTMAKRRSAPRRKSSSKGFASKIPLINNPTFKKAATGIGVATLGVAVLGLVLPQIANQPLVRPILALAGGGVPGVVAQFLVQGGGNLSNILGSGNGGSGGFTPGFG